MPVSQKVQVHYISADGIRGTQISLPSIPDECPRCLRGINAIPISGWMHGDGHEKLEEIFRCPREDCQNFFIAYYEKKFGSKGWSSSYYFEKVAPKAHLKRVFEEVLQETSPEFCKIYNEASEAENRELSNICGAGYRRALEFLIKDYLVGKEADKKDKIIKTQLGKCIDEYVSNENIKRSAKRAAWLGNDETHYIRKWEDKDLSDLKKLIELTVHWIAMEKLSEQYEEEMPEKNKDT